MHAHAVHAKPRGALPSCRADQCDSPPHHSLCDGERLRYVQFQDCLRELDLDDLRHFIVVHTYNDFITELPVTEGMMRSAISPVEVRQAFTVVPANICINLGFRVSCNNAYPAQVFQTDDLFGQPVERSVLRRPLLYWFRSPRQLPVVVDGRPRGRKSTLQTSSSSPLSTSLPPS